MANINELITPMIFTFVRDAVCNMLANERDNQILLAKELGYSDEDIENELKFTIYPKRFRVPDISEMPCVYVYFDNMDFPDEEQYPNENYAMANLQVDYYCVGQNTVVNGITEKYADENAEDRMNYLTSQLYKILSCEGNFCKGTNKIVNHVKIKSWRRIITPAETNQAVSVLGGSFAYELGFFEPTYYANTFKIDELYIKTQIRDEFVSSKVLKVQ